MTDKRTRDDVIKTHATTGEPVDVRTGSVRVTQTAGDPGISGARGRFGGLDVPATLVGMLTAIALVLILGGLVGALVGAIGYQVGLEGNAEELSLGGLIAGLVTLGLAFIIGGWTAGRVARYDGARNGAMTAVWTILLAAVLAALGAWVGAEYNVFANVGLPQWFSSDAATTGAIVSGIVAIALMLGAGILGGMWGERWHRRADVAIASTRGGGIGTAYEGRR